jgi:alpha-D-xyloside xylohydrolase
MKQTYYEPFDFLDFDPEHPGEEFLWKAGRPLKAEQDGNDVLLIVPFQRQRWGRDIEPDRDTAPKNYPLRIRAYGESILRIGIGFDAAPMTDSEMLDIHPDLEIGSLSIDSESDEWQIRDERGKTRARLNLQEAETDHWSDLVPSSEPSLELSFYPDGQKEVSLSDYDQFFPARQEAFPLAFVEKEDSCNRTAMSFQAEPGEVFTGTGERFAKMDLSGKTVQLKNLDAQGVNNRRTYKNIPFFLSSRMTGTFMHTSSYGKISLADHSTRSVQVMAEENRLDIFLIGGSSPGEILYRYRQLTGFPFVPPLWSFGTWMSRMSYFSADEVNRVCDRLREEDYPADVVHLDTGWFRTDWLCEWTFNAERFPDPPGFIEGLRKKGFRVSLWQMPYIASEAAQHDEAVKNNYIGRRGKSTRKGDSNFSALDYAGTIDFTNPEAVEWYRELLKNLLDMGVSCIKTDFGEDIHMDAEYHGMEALKLNNLYALLYQKTAYEITREVCGEGIIWARAGWAGCQRYPVHWGGDAACTWDGMAGSLKGGLHLGLSGFGFWSHDVPGFHGLPDFMNAVIPDELYVRWTQFGVFTSHLRYHGTSKREPWHFPEVSAIIRKWLRLRYALIPYLLNQSEKVTRTGLPMLRALLFHHPGDRLCWHIDDQYYFGDDFLVAPVMNSRNRRDVYLPEGNWINLFTGENQSGNLWLKNIDIPLAEMPVWAKQGAEIPVNPEKISSTDEYDPSKIKIIKFDSSFNGIDHSCIGKLLNEEMKEEE